MSEFLYIPDNDPPAAQRSLLRLYGAGHDMMKELGVERENTRHGFGTRARKAAEESPHRYSMLSLTYKVYRQSPEAGKLLDILGIGPEYDELAGTYESPRVIYDKTYTLAEPYWRHVVRDSAGKPLNHVYSFPGEGYEITWPYSEARLSLGATQTTLDADKEPGTVDRRWDTEVTIINNYKVIGHVSSSTEERRPLKETECQIITSLVRILGQHPDILYKEEHDA